MNFDINFAIKAVSRILTGLPNTLIITVFSMFVGVLIGFWVALVRIQKKPILSQIAAIYISYIRGTPLVVQLYLVFYTLPRMVVVITNSDTAIIFSPMGVALFCFSLSSIAYLSQTIGGALQSVSFTQLEAALSVGETYWQGLFRIVVPQAFKTAFPSLTNSFLNLLKGTSLAYTVMVVDLTARAKIVAQEGFRYIESYLVCAIIYFLLCFSVHKLAGLLEKKINNI